MASDASWGAGFPFQSNESDELAVATAILAAISAKGMIKKNKRKRMWLWLWMPKRNEWSTLL